MRHFMKKPLALIIEPLIFIHIATAMLWGQATTSLRGAGAIVPAAHVGLANTETRIARTTASGADGSYEFLELLPGKYRLQVSISGFRTYVRDGIQLLVRTPATLTVTLEVGKRTETIEVSGEAPVVNTTDATVGGAIGENQVKQLPLEARDVAGLYSLQPGVVY